MPVRAPLLVAAVVMACALAVAPPVGAAPECTNTTPTTTQCERDGHVQVNTSPGVSVRTGPFSETPWWPVAPVYGIGGWAVP